MSAKSSDFSGWTIKTPKAKPKYKKGVFKSKKVGILYGKGVDLLDGNVYKLVPNWEHMDDTALMLVKYGASSKTPVFKSYGQYAIERVGSKAFNTKAGKKVKTAYFKNMCSADDKAFWGAKSMEKLRVRFSAYGWIGDDAFANCGKNDGADFTLKIDQDARNFETHYADEYQDYGLSPDATVEIVNYYSRG